MVTWQSIAGTAPAFLSLFFDVALAAANIDTSLLGPLTAVSAKSTVCNVLDYGAVADNSTDLGAALQSAYDSCASLGNATLYVPPGEYFMNTPVSFGGSGWAFQIDGLITLDSTMVFSGNAFIINNFEDLEIFSSNNLGAINGQGWIGRAGGAPSNTRLMRVENGSHLSIHNLILIDSPAFHLILTNVQNAEVYYITVRGPNQGGSDGIDVSCTGNCHLHDIEVSNRDECISVKAGSNNMLCEDIYCNQSGGMSIGSLVAGNTVSNITMRNIYVYQNTQMLMIKTYPGGTGGQGYVKDCLFENFWAFDTTYALDIDQYWQNTYTAATDTGAVPLSNLIFRNWTGTVDYGAVRGMLAIKGSNVAPLQNITFDDDMVMWTVKGDRVVNICNNVYGSGGCIPEASTTGTASYSLTTSIWIEPTNFVAPASPTWGVADYGLTIPIPVYTPAVMWPVDGTAIIQVAAAAATSSQASSSSQSISSSVTPAALSSSSGAISTISTSTSADVIQSSSSSSVTASSSTIPSSGSAGQHLAGHRKHGHRARCVL